MTGLSHSILLSTSLSSPSRNLKKLSSRHVSALSCKHNARHHATNSGTLDRRDVLLGLGSLYGAASGPALSSPILAPNLSVCAPADVHIDGAPVNCCPPLSSCPVIDFVPPPWPRRLRLRPAAHLVNAAYVAKYEKAVALMKALPPDDPRSFLQQANLHCAYCDGAYHQVGLLDLEVQVHLGWLFFPFHRYYLYFHERILGKLIGDETFALPYWNYDAPRGMVIPAMYTNPSSPLHDALRNPKHQPPVLVNLDYPNEDVRMTDDDRVERNLCLMYRQMITNSKTPEMFFGGAYRAGDMPSPGAGSIEQEPHNTVHSWTGDPAQPNGEDMNAFYSAARDPIFFSHHCNIDRLWYLWKKLGSRNKDLRDEDWLNSNFHFYDENAQLVRVKVKDCLDTSAMGYTYQEVDLPWLHTPPTSRATSSIKNTPPIPQPPTFPFTLDFPVSVMVTRPNPSRSEEEKATQEEVLLVDGIELNRRKHVKFDVYVFSHDMFQDLNPTACEKLGSFTNIPHGRRVRGAHAKLVRTQLRFGLTDVLKLRGDDDVGAVVVTLVPRKGGGEVTIGNIRIDFSPFALLK